jgi:hypothetical protein
MVHQKKTTHPQHRGMLFVIPLFVLLLLLCSACGSTTDDTTGTTNNSNKTPTTLTPTTDGTGGNASASELDIAPSPAKGNTYPVKVYFSKSPESEDTFTAVFPVSRVSPTSGVGTFALEQLIVGPTASEKNAGYYSVLHDNIQGPSNCASSTNTGNFILTLHKKGTQSEQGTATVKFCRTITSAGVGTDARIHAEIDATLKQFPTIKKVVILSKEGHCFGDMSGLDKCLE